MLYSFFFIDLNTSLYLLLRKFLAFFFSQKIALPPCLCICFDAGFFPNILNKFSFIKHEGKHLIIRLKDCVDYYCHREQAAVCSVFAATWVQPVGTLIKINGKDVYRALVSSYKNQKIENLAINNQKNQSISQDEDLEQTTLELKPGGSKDTPELRQ